MCRILAGRQLRHCGCRWWHGLALVGLRSLERASSSRETHRDDALTRVFHSHPFALAKDYILFEMRQIEQQPAIEQPNRSPIAARSSRRPETGLWCSLRNLANCCALHAQAPISGRGCRTFQQLFKSFLITALTFVPSSITCHCGVATYIR